MLTFRVDRTNRLVSVRFWDSITPDDLRMHDRLGAAVLEREGLLKSIVDFSDVAQVLVPTGEFALRGTRPPIMGGMPRIYVVPRGSEIFGLARLYKAYQEQRDSDSPRLVHTLGEAYAALGVVDPRFEAFTLQER
ncbi:MAG: hypothetical protein KF889_29645 [Alphaproteobacteria bacterium]|nr:hypothetical protein [Alphaproteobacteria bacterium]MCW5738574.1 hypothetical protein [Alphaproteobacteria bacterium]